MQWDIALKVPSVIRSTCGGFCNSNCILLRGLSYFQRSFGRERKETSSSGLTLWYKRHVKSACYQNDYNFQLSSIPVLTNSLYNHSIFLIKFVGMMDFFHKIFTIWIDIFLKLVRISYLQHKKYTRSVASKVQIFQDISVLWSNIKSTLSKFLCTCFFCLT